MLQGYGRAGASRGARRRWKLEEPSGGGGGGLAGALCEITKFSDRNSILGVDKTSTAFYTFNPWDTSEYTMDNREPFLLANQVQARVLIAKHPCMQSAVVLDTSDRNMEKLMRDDAIPRPIGSDGHFDTCGKCGSGGELLLCERTGCREALHVRCAGLTDVPIGSWFCKEHDDS